VGKTLVAIWLARYLHATDVLVLCRNSAKWQWRDEIRRYDHRTKLDAPRLHGDKLPVSVLDGTIPEQAATLENRGWVVAHHEAMVHCQLPMIERDWQLVIFDEAHHLRSRDTERYRTAMRLSGIRFAMTAHPFAKAPDELFSILHWLDDETYPSYWRWFRQHVEATKRFFGGFKIHGVRDAKLLRWEIEPFSLRREFSQVFPKAPPPTLSILTLDLPARYRRDYERLKRELFVELESAPDDAPALLIPNVLARVTRLRQFAVDPGLLGSKLRPMKYDLVLEMLEDRGKPTIFFTSFEKVAASFAAKLPKRYTRAVYSGKTKKTREQAKLNFQRGKIDALFVVTQAGGESLNLGGFGGCGFIDLPWTRMAVDQAIGRVHRPVEGSGELIPAVASAFITRDTYEWRIYERVKERGRMFGEVFTVHQLKGLFA
jgi:SNF2 family DNA or RNA helicase